MGRILEFAIATTVIYIIHITLAFFVANTVGRHISELFNAINEALSTIN